MDNITDLNKNIGGLAVYNNPNGTIIESKIANKKIYIDRLLGPEETAIIKSDGIAAINSGLIDVKVERTKGTNYINLGGIIGKSNSNSSLISSYSSGNINVEGKHKINITRTENHVGGIVGYS